MQKKKREIQKEEQWCTKIKFKKKVPKKRKYKMRNCCEKKKEKMRKRKEESPKRSYRKIIGQRRIRFRLLITLVRKGNEFQSPLPVL